MRKYALIVAGGSGSRMENLVPKQFIELEGMPVLMHTFNAFFKYDPDVEFVLVLPKNQVDYWNSLCRQHNFNFTYKLALGGKTRFESVKNGLDRIDDDGIVFIHDGVRPLVSALTLKNCYETALAKGNALPVIPVSESVRFINENGSRSLDRSKYYLVQTPQTFQTKVIKDAYRQEFSDLFTDDASVLENTGATIYPVEGNRENIKITFPEDLSVAAVFLKANL